MPVMGHFERTPSSTEKSNRIEFRGTIEWNSASGSRTAAEILQPGTESGSGSDVPEPARRTEKKAVTFAIRTSLKKRAETAVLQTAGYQGGYTSFAALVEGALERELARLATEFNDSVPFPCNAGSFRQGRPLGG